jgi:hypothetical protein
LNYTTKERRQGVRDQGDKEVMFPESLSLRMQ